MKLTFYKMSVKVCRLFSRSFINASDDTVVMYEFMDDIAGQYPFRTICYMNPAVKLRSQFIDESFHFFSRSDRRGRLYDKQISLLEIRHDTSGRRLNI